MISDFIYYIMTLFLFYYLLFGIRVLLLNMTVAVKKLFLGIRGFHFLVPQDSTLEDFTTL